MSAHANTTVSEDAVLAQQAVSPDAPAATVDPLVRTPPAVNFPHQIRIAILLPTRSASLGKAAAAALEGIKAGYEREPDRIAIQTIETDGSAQDTVRGYADAAAHNDIVIGPLSHSEVNAIAQAHTTLQPTVVLAPRESDNTVSLPRHMIAVGLSIEDEARQAADWVKSGSPAGPVFAVTTDVAWQKRAVKAFAAQAASRGINVEQIELPLMEGYLSADDLILLKKKIQQKNPVLLFVGLDARLTAQLRLAIGSDMPIYGTSQLNPRTPADWKIMDPVVEMDGVRLIDIPWQLEPDHPAVMIYPQLIDQPDEKHGPLVERMYALGIDAYRVARELALDRTQFSLDGVTGRLTVDFDGAYGGFERIEQPAIYRDGVIVPVNVTQ